LKDCIDLNSRILVVGCEDGLLRIFSSAEEEPKQLGVLRGHQPSEMISCVRLLGTGGGGGGGGGETTPRFALSASGDKTLRLWDLEAVSTPQPPLTRCLSSVLCPLSSVLCPLSSVLCPLPSPPSTSRDVLASRSLSLSRVCARVCARARACARVCVCVCVPSWEW
jgi:WD40 repeat protein